MGSDMQFDAANGPGWETHHERLSREWASKGYELPTITYWNLRGDTQGGFMSEASCPGVRLLSGFSPALLKLVLTGEEVDEDEGYGGWRFTREADAVRDDAQSPGRAALRRRA